VNQSNQQYNNYGGGISITSDQFNQSVNNNSLAFLTGSMVDGNRINSMMGSLVQQQFNLQ